MMDFFFILSIGILAGSAACFLGVGGGIIIVPLLPLVFDIGQKEVVGTSLVTVFLIVFLNTLFFHKQKLVQWKTVLFCGFFTSLGAYLAGLSAALLNPIFMKGALAGVICVLALIFFFQSSTYSEILKSSENTKNEKQKIKNTVPIRKEKKQHPFLWALSCLMVGGSSGFTGIGAGAILASSFIHFNKIKRKKVVPVTNAIAMVTSFFGALAFFQMKNTNTNVYLFNAWNLGVIQFDIFLILSLGAIPTTLIGRRFQHHMTSSLRKRSLAVLILIVGIKVFISFIFDLRGVN